MRLAIHRQLCHCGKQRGESRGADYRLKAQHRAKDLFGWLLTLIDQSRSIADMTPERFDKVFGARLRNYGRITSGMARTASGDLGMEH